MSLPHRPLPASADAERAYLCSALLSPGDVLGEYALPAEVFHFPAHAILAEQLAAMHAERLPIDLITVTQRLRDRELLAEVGGPAFVSETFTLLPTAANVASYVEILVKKFTRRQMIAATHALQEQAFDESTAESDLTEDAVTRMVEIAAGRSAEETVRHVKSYAMAAAEEIEYAYHNRGATVGLPTGFVDLDRMLGGWQKGFTYYFGARPAMGKSSLGLNFAIHSAAKAVEGERDLGCPVLFFSVEMTGTQLAKRAIFTLAEINQQRARDGFLSTERDWSKLTTAVAHIAESRLFIDETAALTIADFRARARRWIKRMRRQHGTRQDGKPDGMIWIDYLQRMKGSSKRSEDARYLELQEIAQGISQTAKELQIPIGILAQLKRPRDKKPDTEPDMTEFRECGDIEQEAHVVALIHRPDYYVKHNEEKRASAAEALGERMQCELSVEEFKRYAKLIIDKQREGPVGPVDLRFIADYTKFESWDAKRKRFSNNPEERQRYGEEEV